MKLVPDITDYLLVFVIQTFKTTGPISRSDIIKINRFARNRYTEVFEIADAETRDANIP